LVRTDGIIRGGIARDVACQCRPYVYMSLYIHIEQAHGFNHVDGAVHVCADLSVIYVCSCDCS
jgi:hypothetical protein